MIAFRVLLNRDEAVTAGLPGEHVVSVHADDHREIFRKHQPSSKATNFLRMHIGGLRSAERTRVRWLTRSLTIGDEITIAVVDVPESEISAPTDVEAAAASKGEGDERERLAHLLEKYGAPVDR